MSGVGEARKCKRPVRKRTGRDQETGVNRPAFPVQLGRLRGPPASGPSVTALGARQQPTVFGRTPGYAANAAPDKSTPPRPACPTAHRRQAPAHNGLVNSKPGPPSGDDEPGSHELNRVRPRSVAAGCGRGRHRGQRPPATSPATGLNTASGAPREPARRPHPGASGPDQRQTAAASSSSSARPLVMPGSTWTPGPIVVVIATFLTYLPLAAAGLSLMTSSSAAA